MGYTPTGTRNNSLAVASLVSAAVGWIVGVFGGCILSFIFTPLTLCTGLLFFLGNLAAVITGYMARDQIRESRGAEAGDGMAQAGIIAGIIGLVLSLLLFCFVLASFGGLALLAPQIGNVFSEINSGLSTPSP
jgi:hypothetical protein